MGKGGDGATTEFTVWALCQVFLSALSDASPMNIHPPCRSPYPCTRQRRPVLQRTRAHLARPSDQGVGSHLTSVCNSPTPCLTISLSPFRRPTSSCAYQAVMARVGGRYRRGLRVAAALAAVAAAAASGVEIAWSVCPPIQRYSTVCESTDGLLLMSPTILPRGWQPTVAAIAWRPL